MLKKTIDGGLFIVIEGGDGAGKTTAANDLCNRLNNLGYDAMYTREPGGIKAAEDIRNILKTYELDDNARTLLFAASRALNVSQIIKPNLEKGKIVICDRYIRSTYIYQGFSEWLPDESEDEHYQRQLVFEFIQNYCTGGLKPDVEYILTLPAEVAWERVVGSRGQAPDVLEGDFENFVRVNTAYTRILFNLGYIYNTEYINANKPADDVVQSILNNLRTRGYIDE